MPPECRAVLFDQGPLYRLARLSNTSGRPHPVDDAWWRQAVSAWARQLDLIVWLDAPNLVLVERVAARRKNHLIKDQSPEQAERFLDDFRHRFESVFRALEQVAGPPILTFDTSVTRPAEIVTAITAQLHLGATPTVRAA